MTAIEQASQRASELWLKMCEWDNVSPNEPFVVFSDTNPYKGEYDAAMSFVQTHQQIAHV